MHQSASLRCPGCLGRFEPDAQRCPSCGADVRVVVLTGEPEARAGGTGRRRWLVVPAVLAVWGVLWAAGTRLPSGSQERGAGAGVGRTPAAPSTFSTVGSRSAELIDGRWTCSPGTYTAHGDGRYYPHNHPNLPARLTERPDGCFPTSREAEAAGYRVAAPPTNTIAAGGMYLRPAVLTNGCEQASRALGFAVPCPTRLPDPGPGKAMPRCEGGAAPPCVKRGVFFFEHRGFLLPPSFSTDVAGRAHVVIAAFRGPDRSWPHWLACGGPGGPAEAPSGPGGPPRRVKLVFCSTGSSFLLAHLLAEWSEGEVTYIASLHGRGRNVRQALLQIVAWVRLHEPR